MKYTEEELLQLESLCRELLVMNEELNAKIIAMDAWVKNGDAKLRAAQRYINQLEQIIESFTIQNHN